MDFAASPIIELGHCQHALEQCQRHRVGKAIPSRAAARSSQSAARAVSPHAGSGRRRAPGTRPRGRRRVRPATRQRARGRSTLGLEQRVVGDLVQQVVVEVLFARCPRRRSRVAPAPSPCRAAPAGRGGVGVQRAQRLVPEHRADDARRLQRAPFAGRQRVQPRLQHADQRAGHARPDQPLGPHAPGYRLPCR